ncbi:MAG: hypothetical protein ACXV9P_00985 [Acidimicrobiia bacterium]
MSVEVQATPISRGKRRTGPPSTKVTPSPRKEHPRALQAIWIIGLLAALGVVLPVVVASHYGAMGIPRSDDWSYLLTLFRWVDTGKLTFNGWVSMTLVGQIAIAAPVTAIAGRSITTIQLYTTMIGLVGLVAVVFIGRQVVRPAWWAVFVAATIAAGPLWGPLAPTFMTDIPTFTFEMLTLASAAVAFRRRPLSLPWFAVSVVSGFVAVSIRQYAAIPVMAVIIVAIWMTVIERDWRRLRAVLAISAVFAVAAVAIIAWWSGLPDSKSLSPTFPTFHSVRGTFIKDAGFLRLAGLLILPVVVLAGPVTIVRRAWAASRNLTTLLTTLMVVWLAFTLERVPRTPFLGNYVAREGVLSTDVLSGRRPDLFPRSVFLSLAVVASISGMLIVLAAVPFFTELPRRLRGRELPKPSSPVVALIGLTVTGFAVAYSLAILTELPVYDRYALPLLPLVAFLLLHAARRETVGETVGAAAGPPRARTVWAGVAFALLAILGLCYATDSASFDGTRWKLAEMVTKKGYTPTQVGGGFEWLGYHRQHSRTFQRDGEEGRINRTFAAPCVTVLINPAPSRIRGQIVAEAESGALSRKPVRIVAFRNKQPCVKGRGAPSDDNSTPIATHGGTAP